jgi:serine/threonine-protein kinase HipA
LTLVNFLIGNEDAHVKNSSLIKRGVKVELAPAYDLVNSTIVLSGPEEIALPLSGKTESAESGNTSSNTWRANE